MGPYNLKITTRGLYNVKYSAFFHTIEKKIIFIYGVVLNCFKTRGVFMSLLVKFINRCNLHACHPSVCLILVTISLNGGCHMSALYNCKQNTVFVPNMAPALIMAPPCFLALNA